MQVVPLTFQVQAVARVNYRTPANHLDENVAFGPVRDIFKAYEIEKSEFVDREVLPLKLFLYMHAQARGLIWGAYVDGELAAFIMATITETQHVTMDSVRVHRPDGNYLYIQSLATAREYQGRGIAQSLICHFLRHVQIKWPRMQYAMLLNHLSLVRFYQKLGFLRVGASSVFLFDQNDWIEMRFDFRPTILSEKRAQGLL